MPPPLFPSFSTFSTKFRTKIYRFDYKFVAHFLHYKTEILVLISWKICNKNSENKEDHVILGNWGLKFPMPIFRGCQYIHKGCVSILTILTQSRKGLLLLVFISISTPTFPWKKKLWITPTYQYLPELLKDAMVWLIERWSQISLLRTFRSLSLCTATC